MAALLGAAFIAMVLGGAGRADVVQVCQPNRYGQIVCVYTYRPDYYTGNECGADAGTCRTMHNLGHPDE